MSRTHALLACLFFLFSCKSSTAQLCNISQIPSNLRSGLVAYYPFCGNANDISGNGNTLQSFGVTATTDRFGNSSSAYSFSNTQTNVTSYLKAVNPTPFATSNYTISAWFNSSQFYPNISGVTYNYQSIVFYSPQWYNYGPAYHIALQHANNSVLEGGHWTVANTGQGLNSVNGAISTNQWYHVVMSYDGTTLKMYLNGSLIGSRAATLSYANQIQFLIGGAGDGPSPGGIYGGFNGKLDDIGFWNRPLSNCEITQLYNQTSTSLPNLGNISFNPLADTTRVCGTTSTLNAGSGFSSYSWNTGAATQSITPTSSGFYNVTVVNSDGCTASDSTYLSLVKANILNNDTTICLGSSITLSIDSLFPGQTSCTSGQLPEAIRNGLVAYYPFCGNANNALGNGNNGTVYNATLTTDRFGNANSAYSFNGTNAYIDFGSNTSIGPTSTIPISISLWVSGGASGNIISKYTNLDASNSFFYFNRSANGYQWVGNGTNPYINNTGVTDNSWTHYVLVGAAGTNNSKVYRNGVLIASGTLALNSTMRAINLLVGRLGGAFPGYLNGKVDDIFIYNKILTASEIQNLYLQQPTVTWSTGATTNQITVSPTQGTTYYVTINDGITTCTDSVRVNISEIGSFNPLTDTTRVCGATASLDAGTGYSSYSWNNGSTSQAIAPTSSGFYKVVVANAFGCTTADSTTVSIVKANILNSDTTICLGSSISLSIDSLFASRTACSQSILPYSFRNGLVAYYPFCGNFTDVISEQPATSFGVTRVADRFNSPNSAAFFNGAAWLEGLSSNLPVGASARTVCFWYKEDQSTLNPGNNAVAWGPNVQGSRFDVSFNHQVAGFSTGAASSAKTLQFQNGSSVSNWNFYCAVVPVMANPKVSDVILYQNGVQLTNLLYSTSLTTILNTIASTPLIIGKNTDVGDQAFLRGTFDDLFIFNRALSASEIQGLYMRQPTVSWSTGSSSNSITVSPTQSTTYYVTVSDGITSCVDSVRVNVNSIGAFNPLPDTIRQCGTSTVLDAGAGYTTYTWSNGAITRTISPNVSGMYSVIVTNQFGCSAVDSTYLSLVKATIVNNDTTICLGTSVVLSIDSVFARVVNKLHTNSFQSVSPSWTNLRLLNYNSQSVAGNYRNDSLRYNSTSVPMHDSILVDAELYLFDSWDGNCGGSQGPDYWGILATGGGLFRTTFSNYPIGSQNCSTQAYPGQFGNVNPWGTGALVTNLPAINWSAPVSTKYRVLKTLNHNSSSLALSFFGNNLQTDESWGIDNVSISTILSRPQVTWSTGATTNQITVSPTQSTTYYVTVSDGITTCTDSVRITVAEVDTAVIVLDPLQVCTNGGQVRMQAGIATAYQWLRNGVIISGATSRLYTATQTGSYRVALINAAGCRDTSRIINVSLYPQPVSGFIVNSTTQCYAGNLFSFTNTTSLSAGTISYFWSFGNGVTSTQQNPTYTYPAAGTYIVKLVATSGNGCKDSTIQTITVNPSPTTIFSVNSTNQCISGNQFSFTNNSSITSGILSYVWTFGDGNISTSANPTHSYLVSGSYTVKLVVTSSLGCKDSTTRSITVFDKPSVNFSVNASDQCVNGNSFVFTNTSSITSGAVSYVWRFGDGNTVSTTNATHTYLLPGTYIVKLIATSNNGCSDSTIQTVTVNPKPTVDFSINNAAQCLSGNQFVFTNNSSITSGTLTYAWTFSDGNVSTNANPSHSYINAGTYTVKLVVTSALGCKDSTTRSVNVYAKPSVDFSINSLAQCVNENSFVFTNNTTIVSGTITYIWRFGDGNTVTTTNPTHSYLNAGTYTVTLVARSNNGCSDSTTQVVTVNPKPTVDFSVNNATQCLTANQFIFTNNSSITSGTLTHAWTFGDGASSALISPTHSYASSGTYIVKLLSISAEGCTDSITRNITVYAMPVGSLNTPSTSLLCEGGTVSLSALGGTSYQWFINGGAIVGATSATYAATQPGTYTVNVISSNGCVAAATGAVTLQLVRKPMVNFTFDKYCAGFPTSFFDQSNTANSNVVTYNWVFGQSQGTSSLQNPNYTFTSANSYSVSLTVTPVACPSLANSITKSINVVAAPANQRYTSVNVVENRNFQLEARQFSGATYSWAPPTGLSNTGIQNPIFNHNAEIDYIISITTGIGCVVKDTQLVRIFKEKEIYVPKGFSPNNDGNNDKIFPRLVGVRTLTYFKIYNRWGQLIFMTTNLNEGWDGTYKGVKQPVEGYVWIAEGIDIDNNIIKRTGTLLLLR